MATADQETEEETYLDAPDEEADLPAPDAAANVEQHEYAMPDDAGQPREEASESGEEESDKPIEFDSVPSWR